ncbi:MAG: cyclic 2,3-diphosphoglycerate synthase [Planctomycetota bacterium]|jgi:predicted GTPase
MQRIRALIMGAAGRDFHNFNLRFRADDTREVVAFTAAQIPYIVGRTYPPELAGPLYPSGIPIHDEKDITALIRERGIREVTFSYSDIAYPHLMNRASVVQAAGADFILPDPHTLMIPAVKPVIAICAVRTGCGKSQTTRRIAEILRERQVRVAVVRHPMPYGKLLEQKCQRFETREDLKRYRCTIEEREEYEPHLEKGFLVYAGVDYEEILRSAEKEADVVLWDGGNNDMPFFKPDLLITVADPHRLGHERNYYPGELNARLADVFVINKEDSAKAEAIQALENSLEGLNPGATIVHADSPITVEDPEAIAGKKVLCIEDGPTLTHGEMEFGAAVLAARTYKAATIVDPRPWVSGTIQDTFDNYPGIGPLLPAMGYSPEQVRDLEAVINRVECDLVLIGTPIDLTRLVRIDKPVQRVRYELQDKEEPTLQSRVNAFLDEQLGKGA